MCPTRISPMEGRQRVATSSVIDLIEGNAAVPTAASKGLPAHHKFPRVHAAGSYEDYLAAITVAVCEQYPTTAPTRVARRSRHAYRSASVLGGGGGYPCAAPGRLWARPGCSSRVEQLQLFNHRQAIPRRAASRRSRQASRGRTAASQSAFVPVSVMLSGATGYFDKRKLVTQRYGV